MNFLHYLINARKFIQNKGSASSIKFFQKDKASRSLWFEILISYYKKDTNKNIEAIVERIPKEFGSRPKIFSIINDAIKLNFIIKKRDKIDQRKYNLIATELTINEFEIYVTNLSEVLSNKKDENSF